VPPEAALADRPEEIPERAISEEVEALVRNLELERLIRLPGPAAGALPPLLLTLQVR
jgi:hypothetical protein